ncbi:MAG: vWA domain-containing protein [Myxococcota bacterium]
MLVLTSGCQSYPFSFQTNQRVEARSYQEQVSTSDKTDILFVIDNSPSMAEERANLQQNIGRFIEVLSRSVVDYQVGVITPDADRVPGSNCEPCCDLDTNGNGLPDFSGCDGGRLVAADGLRRVFPRPTSEDPVELQLKTEQFIQDFNDVVASLGKGGSPFERSFETMQTALSPDSEVAVRALNFGFLRPDAALAVIFMTDEDDCTHADKAWYTQAGRDDSDCYVDPTAQPVSEFIDFLQDLKGGSIDLVRGAAIIGSVESVAAPLGYEAAGCFTDAESLPSNECGCWSTRYVPDRTTSDPDDELFCNVISAPPYNQTSERVPDLGAGQGGCSTLPGGRYVQFLEEINNRRIAAGLKLGVVVDSVCRADYGPTLERIAIDVVSDNCFRLIEQPSLDFESIRVVRNGEVLPEVDEDSDESGWIYNVDSNRVCLANITKSVNDTYEITVVSGTRGFEEEEE